MTVRPERRKRNAASAAQPAGQPEAMRDQILAAAARLFREQGYAATTLRQIAEATGIQAGSIYYHFGSKDEILGVVLDTGIAAVTAAVQSRIAALPPSATQRDRIAAAIEGHLAGLLQHGDFTSANIRVFGQIPLAARNRHRLIRNSYAQYWDELLEQALASGELRSDISLAVIRLFVIGALNWTVEWYNPRRGTFKTFAAQITDIVFDGITQPPAAPPRGTRTKRG
jgi:AcrR family transcriptional regulator